MKTKKTKKEKRKKKKRNKLRSQMMMRGKSKKLTAYFRSLDLKEQKKITS